MNKISLKYAIFGYSVKLIIYRSNESISVDRPLSTSPVFKKDSRQARTSISPSKRVSFKQLDTQFGKDVIFEAENEDEFVKESKEANESKNIIHEYEEELKECFPSDRDIDRKDEAFSPGQMTKKTPSYFMDKKSSLDMSKLFPNGASPRNNNFFTNNLVEQLGKIICLRLNIFVTHLCGEF